MRNYFNPRTREGCDAERIGKFQTYPWISIHAPVKGATNSAVLSKACWPYFNPRTREGCDAIKVQRHLHHFHISIHAPVKGATLILKGTMGRRLHFNPRTREGCDADVRIDGADCHAAISIHAPVKGATVPHCIKSVDNDLFQSTHP